MGAFDSLYNSLSSAVKKTTSVLNGALSGGGDRGSSYADRGVVSRSGANDETPVYNYVYGGGGGYGGYGGKSPSETQKETQAQINNTAGNYNYRGGDIAAGGVESLKNIKAQIEKNREQYQQKRKEDMQAIEWQPQQQRQQSTEFAQRNRMGNGLYSSMLVDLVEGMARVDDMADNALINAWKGTSNATYSDYAQAENDLVSDYIDQVVSLKDEFSKLFSQYWATLSNINPLLATRENVDKSARGKSSSVGSGTDAYTLPGARNVAQNTLPSDELKKLYTYPTRVSTVNPYTKSFVRPPRAVNKANKIADTGTANRFTAANQGYNDNLGVYRRRV